MKYADTNYKSIIEKLDESYSNYIKNKEIVINVVIDTVIIGGGVILTSSTIGVETALGITMLGSIIFSEECVKKKYKKELLQVISIGELGNTKEIEKYYKQLPKKLREKWAKANVFAKLAKHLRETFPKDKMYSEYINFNSQKLDDSNENDINEGWIIVSKQDEAVEIIGYDS